MSDVPTGGSPTADARWQRVQDLFGAPLVSGTFGGGTISFPMAGITPPTPVGLTSSPAPVTGPDFNVFLVTTLP